MNNNCIKTEDWKFEQHSFLMKNIQSKCNTIYLLRPWQSPLRQTGRGFRNDVIGVNSKDGDDWSWRGENMSEWNYRRLPN